MNKFVLKQQDRPAEKARLQFAGNNFIHFAYKQCIGGAKSPSARTGSNNSLHLVSGMASGCTKNCTLPMLQKRGACSSGAVNMEAHAILWKLGHFLNQATMGG